LEKQREQHERKIITDWKTRPSAHSMNSALVFGPIEPLRVGFLAIGRRRLRHTHMKAFLFAAALMVFPFPDCLARADEILVAAAASLTDALRDLGKSFQEKSNHKILLTLGPSNLLARQIDEGASADIFFSADTAQMDFLDKRGRLEPNSRKNLLSNQLVMIIRSDSPLAIASAKDLLKPEVKKIAFADPAAVPAGIYASKYLADEGLWDKIRPKVVPVLDVRAVLASVESANVEAGFTYKTDAAISKKVKVAFAVPLDKGPRITYPIAIIKDSQNKKAARDFMNYAQSPTGKALFKKYGFVVLE
jgi:molybdate transport system substrate-binding protein